MTIDERRLNQRHATEQELEAYDMHSARFIGRFVDISEDGFLLFCPQLVDVDSVWQVRVLAANDQRLQTLLSFGAECLWVRTADAKDRSYSLSSAKGRYRARPPRSSTRKHAAWSK